MPFKPEEKECVLSALKTLTAFVEAQEVSKSCPTCMHSDRGCKLAGKEMTARTGAEKGMSELGLGWGGVLGLVYPQPARGHPTVGAALVWRPQPQARSYSPMRRRL